MPARPTAGFFNPVHPSTCQVLGEAGSRYLFRLAPRARATLARQLARKGMRELLLARGAQAAPGPWRAAGIRLTSRDLPAHELVQDLRHELAGRQAARRVVHGVLLQVHGVGLLVEGPPGCGKSTLALDLLGRGHALVADDAVEVERPASGLLVGRAPRLLAGYLEARGLGVLDVRRMHGTRAVRDRSRIDLLLQLSAGRRRLGAAARLSGSRASRRLLGVTVPVLELPARSFSARTGHNLATLVEAACLDWRLREDGIAADAMLERRQARALKRNG